MIRMAAGDYEDVQAVLASARAPFDAADSHGAACALLAIKPKAVARVWLDDVLGDAHNDAQARARLEQVFEATRAQLDDPEMALQLLLPEAERAPLSECVQAVARWSQGFMFGLGLSAIDVERDLSQDSAELIRDVAKIAHARAPGSEDEQDEAALAEIIEYLRAGVFLLREDALRAHAQPSQKSLH